MPRHSRQHEIVIRPPWLLLLAAAALGNAPLLAQGTSAPTRGEDPAAQQRTVRAQVEQLESRMLTLSRVLAESEPEKVERLRRALDLTGRKQVKRRLNEIVAALESGRLGEAEQMQAALLADLQAIRDQLTEPVDVFAQQRAARQRLEAQKRSIEQLRQRQQTHLYQTQVTAEAARTAQEFRQEAEQLAELLERQDRLQDASRADRVAEQQALADETRAAADRLADRAAENDRASSWAEASTAARQAADAMQQAANQPDEPSSESTSEQEAAASHLKRAIRRLQTAAREAARQAAELEQAQRALARDAANLENEMRPADGGNAQPAGQRQVSTARGHMQRAADRLAESEPQSARAQQEAALEQLQRALDELDDALRQVRREELRETLTTLETRFRSMLERQRSVRAEVAPLYERADRDLNQTDALRLAAAADAQHQIADDCRAAVRILESEGTTLILPELAAQLADDMSAAAESLDQGRLLEGELARLDSIVDRLTEILAAIETRRQEQSEEPLRQQQGSQPPDTRPLLPASAEFKLLRSSQLRINRATADWAGRPAGAQREAVLEQLAAQQRRLTDLTRRMAEIR